MAKERINKSGVNKDLNIEGKEMVIIDLEKIEINDETPEVRISLVNNIYYSLKSQAISIL